MPATLHSLEQKFIALKTDLARRQGHKAQLDAQHEAAQADLAAAAARRHLYEQTAELLLKASGTARELAKTKVEHLVTLGLTSVTDEPYSFRMDMQQSAGQWVVNFVVVSPQGIELDPIEGCGGGIADIASMTLRIAILQMFEPAIEGPLMLDESGKYISAEHRPRFVEFLHTIKEKTERQIIFVTHAPEFAAGADRVFEVAMNGSTSTITIQGAEDGPALASLSQLR